MEAEHKPAAVGRLAAVVWCQLLGWAVPVAVAVREAAPPQG